MRAEVIREFHDAREGYLLRSVGEVFEADDDRVVELADRGFVTAVEDEPAPPKPKRAARRRKPKE